MSDPQAASDSVSAERIRSPKLQAIYDNWLFTRAARRRREA